MAAKKRTLVAKIGTSSITDDSGHVDAAMMQKLCHEIAQVRELGWNVILVSSGAVAAGLPAIGITKRPKDTLTLQSASAVGQSRLMQMYNVEFGKLGIVCGQMLLIPFDFSTKSKHHKGKEVLARLLEMGVVPIINENDAVAAGELRFGDNDRLAALVAHMVKADLLVLQTDIDGLYTANPRTDPNAELIAEIDRVTPELEKRAGGTGSDRGSGGMLSKMRSAKIATYGGSNVLIAKSQRPNLLVDAVNGVKGLGTHVQRQLVSRSTRTLWIGFAADTDGFVSIDDGARAALVDRGGSLLSVGVREVDGDFEVGDCIEVKHSGDVIARGLARLSAADARDAVDRRSNGREDSVERVAEGLLIHRNDLVLTL